MGATSAPAHRSATSSSSSPAEAPLTCMIYFFATQMRQNSRVVDTYTAPAPATHPLDALLARIGTHAAFSPLVMHFETFPVEVTLSGPPSSHRSRGLLPRDVNHDTLLLISFRSARAREEWIRTREWHEFMERTERDGVFRRLPHVRCAGSVRGLGNVREVLGI